MKRSICSSDARPTTIGTWIGKYAIVRHVLVGGTATVVHFGTYYALTALSVNYNLAFTVGVACGATAVIVPEHPVDYEADLLEPIRRARLAGRTHFMIIVAEGVEGGAYSIGKVIEEATALDTRVTVLGHIQRGGSPSSRDRITATYMGYEAVRLLAEGKTCRVVALQGENYVDYDITEALQMTKSLDQHTYEVMRALTGVH